MKSMRFGSVILVFLFVFSSQGAGHAQEVPQALKLMKEGENEIKKLDGKCAKCEAQKNLEKKVEGLFDQRTLIKVTFSGAFTGKLKGDPGPHGMGFPDHSLTRSPGTVEIESHGQKFPVQLERRGGGRGGCPVPLLKVIWEKKEPKIQGTLFDPLKDNDMRWVSECMDSDKPFHVNVDEPEHSTVMIEYLAQRWMEESGFPALRVRLAEVTYLDTANGNQKFVRKMQYGFFIEPDKDIEKRLNVSVLPLKMMTPGYNDVDFMANSKSDHTLAIPTILIQVLMDNWDYDLGKNKNTLVLMKKIEGKKKADLHKDGIYAGVLPYDMAISVNSILHFARTPETITSILSKLRSHFHGNTSGYNGQIPNLDQARWKSEFIRYSKELLPKRQAFLNQIKDLPVQLPGGVAARVEAFFGALQLLVQESGQK